MKLKVDNAVFDCRGLTNIREIYRDVYQEEVPEKYYNHTGIVLDDKGQEITRFYHPYESMTLHTTQPDAMETVREDYDIPKDVFRRMCQEWLDNNE